MLDEKRLKALYHFQGYQRRLRKAFDEKVRTRDLKLGDLVLKEIQASVQDVNRKFKQNWVGSYIIKQIYFGGVERLMDLDANPFFEPTNMDQLKKYHKQTNKQKIRLVENSKGQATQKESKKKKNNNNNNKSERSCWVENPKGQPRKK